MREPVAPRIARRKPSCVEVRTSPELGKPSNPAAKRVPEIVKNQHKADNFKNTSFVVLFY